MLLNSIQFIVLGYKFDINLLSIINDNYIHDSVLTRYSTGRMGLALFARITFQYY